MKLPEYLPAIALPLAILLLMVAVFSAGKRQAEVIYEADNAMDSVSNIQLELIQCNLDLHDIRGQWFDEMILNVMRSTPDTVSR